ncbi:hypothetical protein NIB75_02575 [Bacteroides uniformis]|nr:hypothetical protein [Bacteroides uniformis]
MRNVKHGIIPPSGFRISSSPFRTPSVNASRLLAAGLYLQKTFAYSHEDKLCDSIGVVALRRGRSAAGGKAISVTTICPKVR